MSQVQTSSNDDGRLARIRELNDQLRRFKAGGRILLTVGISSQPQEVVVAILLAIAAFNDFTPDNDPWGEHDCGALTIAEVDVLWKIDYYDHSVMSLSPDPSDPDVTVRVLTMMRVDEY
jgi:Protein of unknown function (DUF3768)